MIMKTIRVLQFLFALMAVFFQEQLSAQYTPAINSFTSTDNSSTTPLSNGATFTGTWENCEKYADLIVAVKADQNGIFYIDFSPDGTNVDSTLTKYYNTTDIEAPHRFTVTRKFFRVRFTNDSGSDQTAFRLQSSLKVSSNSLNAPLDQSLARDYDSIPVRPSLYRFEVAQGLRQGHSLWNKFGYNNDIDTGAAEVLAAFGGSFTPLTAASTLTIVSSSANDDLVGTGAQRIIIYGVDANRLNQIEVVDMDGLTPVVTATSWLGVNRVAIYVAGTLQKNDGTITVTATTGGSVQASMPAGEGTSQQLIFFTQDNHQAMVEWLTLDIVKITGGGGAPIVTIKGWVYSAVSNARYEVFRLAVDTSVENNVIMNPPLPFVIGEKSVFWLEGTTDTNNTVVNARFSLVDIKDKDAD